jgi:membrane protein
MFAGLKARGLALKASLERYEVFRILESTAEGFTKDRVPENAAAMTYYGIFSLFPLLLLFMSLAGLALQSNEAAREQIMGVIVGLLPEGQATLRDVIQDVINAKGTAAGIGILTLLWGALGWFQVIDTNINEIWGVSKPRSFVRGKLFALGTVAGIGGVVLLSFVATAAINLFQRLTGEVPGSALLWQVVVSLVSLLTLAGVFYVLYRYAPQRAIVTSDVWPAALATSVIFEVTRRLLAFYLEKNNMVSGYGPIGAAMALLFWIYISSIIILFGAEMSYAVAKERRHIPMDKEMEVVSPPGEQPTPKFAPQVGRGSTAPQDEAEPIKAESAESPSTGQASHAATRPAPASPASTGAAGAVVATPAMAGAGKAKPIHLDVPLVAMASMSLGFVLGWLGKRDEHSA